MKYGSICSGIGGFDCGLDRAGFECAWQKHAESIGVTLKSEVFKNPDTWREYAVQQLLQMEEVAHYMRLHQLHLWPDKSLGSKAAIVQAESGGKRTCYKQWLERWWNRISEWPI